MTPRFWGKAGKAEQGDGSWHPLEYHCLDVAAVGLRLLERNPLWRRRFAGMCGLEEGTLLSHLPFFLALHDIGKYADGFQALRSDLMAELQGEVRSPGYPERHDTVGFWLWQQRLAPELLARYPGFFPHEDDLEREDLASRWFAAVAGHHGRPPKPYEPGFRGDLIRQFSQLAEVAARAFSSAMAELLVPDGLLVPSGAPDTLDRRLRRSSFWLAGWATTADWIGSNRDWFPFVPDSMPLDVYWAQHARPGAEIAVRKSGLGERASRPACGFHELWQQPSWKPSSLQALAESIPLEEGPQLYLLEDATGAGKTEAALLLAHRLIAAGQASGLYFALPTMATANAMHLRVGEMYRRLFAEGEEASLVLAHSKRDLFLPLEEVKVDGPYTAGRQGESSASLDCAAWLADSRKKALLAQVGVGTIDQALIAVLPIRHQSLRLAGLAGKVLLVDEVHACDAYVGTLLERVLEFHAAFGGSAILLSATLPRRQRESLLAAFARGRGELAPGVAKQAYPLLTRFSSGKPIEVPVQRGEAVPRPTLFQPLRSEGDAEDWLLATCAAGGCACWVRNTVGDAIAAYDRLVARRGEERVMLFHSRFAVADRRAIEERVLGAFGPASETEDRRGKLLVATQVVEQSLDLDFDAMVTDLAPIDLVIQRAGRLRRHARRRDGRRSDRDERGDAVLGVLAPEPIPEPDATWYSTLFPTGAYVYPDHGRLWLTARWLESRGRFVLLDDARDAIEAVYGDDSEAQIPRGFERATLEAEGSSQADKSVALGNALGLNTGYAVTLTDWIDDAVTPTRLSEPTTVLRLVRRTPDGLEPWDDEGRHVWEGSEVSVLRKKAAAEAGDPAQLASLRAQMRDGGRYCVLVVLKPEGDAWKGRVLDEQGRERVVSYSAQRGLEISSDKDNA